jgi:hypothetical protein
VHERRGCRKFLLLTTLVLGRKLVLSIRAQHKPVTFMPHHKKTEHMNLSILKITLISCIVALTACNNVKVNTSDSVFEKFSPTTKEYKNELATKLKSNPEGLLYTFNKFVENDGKEYLDIQVRGDDFEATGLVLVNNWNKLEGIRRTKGQSYETAELRGLKLVIQENPLGANLVYNDLEKIVD